MSTSNNKTYFNASPVARSTPYDNSVSELVATDVQAAIDELDLNINNAASPGFTWGRSGSSPAGTYLLNDSVVSSSTGRTIYLVSALIRKVYVSQQNATIIKLNVYYHDGNSSGLTLVGSVTTAATRTNSFSVSWSVPVNKQLAVRVATDTPNIAQNCVVALILTGSLA